MYKVKVTLGRVSAMEMLTKVQGLISSEVHKFKKTSKVVNFEYHKNWESVKHIRREIASL